MEKHSIWDLCQEVRRLIVPHFLPLFDQFAERNNLDPRVMGLLLMVVSVDPDPISPEKVARRNPYSSQTYFLQGLNSACVHEMLEQVDPGQFVFTLAGREKSIDFIGELRQKIESIDPLEGKVSRELGILLDRLVQSMLKTPPPPDTWSIELSYKIMPEAEFIFAFIEQALSCLYAYRDDCHLAAWQPTGLSGPAVEALTLIWRGEAESLTEICNKLVHRQHPEKIYHEVLEDLRTAGYLEGEDMHFTITAKGKGFREIVEQGTDSYFYRPWDCLSDGELRRMHQILLELRTELGEIKEGA